jgi:hypothetical protein
MGGAKRYPSTSVRVMMGFASLYPSYELQIPGVPFPPRHCERSEAIHGAAGREVDCFAALAMTAERACAFSRRDTPEACLKLPALFVRGRREDRVLAAPAVPRAICANKTAHERTGQLEHSGLPCAMALRLTSCSPRRTALLPPSPSRSFASPGLSASTATPEPHDFTVRFRRVRLARPQRPPHLTARS